MKSACVCIHSCRILEASLLRCWRKSHLTKRNKRLPKWIRNQRNEKKQSLKGINYCYIKRSYLNSVDSNKRQKTEEKSDEVEAAVNVPEAPIPAEGKKEKKENAVGNWRANEAAITFVSDEDATLTRTMDYYGIPSEFPRHQIFSRAEPGNEHHAFFFVSSAVHKILTCADVQRLRVVNAGVRIFKRNESKISDVCDYRLTNEGLPLLCSYIKEECTIEPTLDDVIKMIEIEYIHFDRLEGIREKLLSFPISCFMLRFQPPSIGDA